MPDTITVGRAVSGRAGPFGQPGKYRWPPAEANWVPTALLFSSLPGSSAGKITNRIAVAAAAAVGLDGGDDGPGAGGPLRVLDVDARALHATARAAVSTASILVPVAAAAVGLDGGDEGPAGGGPLRVLDVEAQALHATAGAAASAVATAPILVPVAESGQPASRHKSRTLCSTARVGSTPRRDLGSPNLLQKSMGVALRDISTRWFQPSLESCIQSQGPRLLMVAPR
ncbi:uncharacterized protein LOC123396163 [Hordeum vulgare subsp. vulgare]|uniref:uncharacterized protein LOC123396163 n=1 Tax=Hordeum vulgare subsp. vulgare TaxID=112509 RepID=UPI001D1A51C6|nr:uncharacterized protein LOC123396163 [Hordeum vulgare subsp. vulgare]